MNSNIEIFNYNTHEVRTVNKDGEVWFVAQDVCDVLGLSNPTEALKSLDDDEKNTLRISEGNRGNPNLNIISEPGLYALTLRSNKPEARKFSRWVRHELLPQVLRTGTYSAHNAHNVLPDNAIKEAQVIFESVGITGNQLGLALDKLYRSYTGRSALMAAGIELEAPVKEQALNPTQIAETLGIGKGNQGARIVNTLLLNAGYQRRVGNHWEPAELGNPYAYVVDTNKKHSDGTPVIQLKWYTSILDILKKLVQEMSKAMNLAQAV